MKRPIHVRLSETDPVFPVRILRDDCVNVLANHWHRETEIIFMEKGNETFYVNGIKYLLNEGDIILIAGGDVHSALRSPENIRIVVQFDDVIFEDRYTADINCVRGHICRLERFSRNWPSHVYDCIKKIIFDLKYNYDRMNKAELCYEFSVKALIYSLVYVLINDLPEDVAQTERVARILNKDILAKLIVVFRHINQNYNNPVTIKEAAKMIGYSPNYFVKFWKRYMGITFHEYLNNLRIQTAMGRLISEDIPIAEIAAETGYPNVKTFNRLFKTHTGMTPSKYRKEYF